MGNVQSVATQRDWPKFELISPKELSKLHPGDHIVWDRFNGKFQDAIVANIDCDRMEITYLYHPCNDPVFRYTIAETSDPFLQYTGMIYKVHHSSEFFPDVTLEKAISCEIKYDFQASSIYTDFATYCKTGQETGTLCPLCSKSEKNRFPDYEQHEVRSVQEIQRTDFIIMKSNSHHQHAMVVNVDKEEEIITVVSCSCSEEKKSIHKTLLKIQPFTPDSGEVHVVRLHEPLSHEETNKVIHRAIGREWKVGHYVQMDRRNYAIKCKTSEFDNDWFKDFHLRQIRLTTTDEPAQYETIEAEKDKKRHPPEYEEIKSIFHLQPSDHIKWNRVGGYDHHGIVTAIYLAVSKVTVVHYQKSKDKGVITVDTLDPFKKKDDVCRVNHRYSNSPDVAIHRAKTKLGTEGYNLATNNCEHFAIWSKTGQHESWQSQSAGVICGKTGAVAAGSITFNTAERTAGLVSKSLAPLCRVIPAQGVRAVCHASLVAMAATELILFLIDIGKMVKNRKFDTEIFIKGSTRLMLTGGGVTIGVFIAGPWGAITATLVGLLGLPLSVLVARLLKKVANKFKTTEEECKEKGIAVRHRDSVVHMIMLMLDASSLYMTVMDMRMQLTNPLSSVWHIHPSH